MKAIVVGAGIGGLGTAIRLAANGYSVQVFERADRAGGRAAVIRDAGFSIDTGPSILLMRDIIEEIFRAAGRRPDDYVKITRLDPAYRVHFADGSWLDARVPLDEFKAEIERIEPGSFERFLAFAAKGAELYYGARREFVETNINTLGEMLGPAKLPAYLRLEVFSTVYRLLARYFKDERLRQLMSFNSMYIGMNPHTAAGVYALLPYNDLVEGVFFCKGGRYALVEALVRLAGELGVEILTSTPVQRVLLNGRRAEGVQLPGGRLERGDLVVVNADLPWAYRNLLPGLPLRRPALLPLRYSPSCVNFYFGVRGLPPDGFFPHNIFLSGRFQENFQAVFEGRMLEEPSYYVHIPSLADPDLAPTGGSVVYVLVPGPNLQRPNDWPAAVARTRRFVLGDLKRRGWDIEPHLLIERKLAPPDWAEDFALEHGATFALSHNPLQVGYFRPHNRDGRTDNLYFVGSSTHPGAGVPMVLLLGEADCRTHPRGAGLTRGGTGIAPAGRRDRVGAHRSATPPARNLRRWRGGASEGRRPGCTGRAGSAGFRRAPAPRRSQPRPPPPAVQGHARCLLGVGPPGRHRRVARTGQHPRRLPGEAQRRALSLVVRTTAPP